ncbi:MAG: T9SS type A sorting domain-containing protein [Candidatus Zixiibacteriota bacterium]|nr:MAG: T9SS type A sorting domain-containing protein [candidate division Zixibacteria bacterium]
MPLTPTVRYVKPTSLAILAAFWTAWASVSAVERTDFLVNDDGGPAAQNDPRIAVAGGQGFAIAWVDRRNGNSDIYLQHYDSDGYPIGGNLLVNDDFNSSYQFEPAVSGDVFGRYSFVWKDYRNDSYPFKPDIYLQSFDDQLSPVGVNVNLTEDQPDSTKESPDIALAEGGGGVVVWADYRNRNWDIYGQIVSAGGELVGENFLVNDDVNQGQQHAPRVAISPLGWFVVVWYDNRLGSDDIFIQRFDSLGNRLGVNIKVNADTQNARQAFPDVATDGAGCFTVVWVDWRSGTYPANPDIYSRKYDTLMIPLTSEIRVNTDQTQNAQREPAISADRMGNVAIVWSDSTVTSWDVNGQMIDVDGVVREANFRANSTSANDQLAPDVALDGYYRYVTWADNRSGNWDVYASIQTYNNPSLEVSPATLRFEARTGEPPPEAQVINVNHLGYNPLDFTVTSNVDWLSAAPGSSSTPQDITVSVTVDAFSAGAYSGALLLTSELESSPSTSVGILLDVIDYVGQTDDTLRVESAGAGTGQSSQTSLTAYLDNNVSQVILPIQFEPLVLTIDSAILSEALTPMATFSCIADNSSGLVLLEWTTVDPANQFESGETYLGEIFFTTADTTATVFLEPASNDTLAPLVVMGHVQGSPVTIAGQITVSPLTGVDGDGLEGQPNQYCLRQNWPNPFNGTTIISYSLPHSTKVTLEVFNILGQSVKNLVSGRQSAGSHSVNWDGRLRDGRSAPSGIYFCRLQAGSVSLVARMVIIR